MESYVLRPRYAHEAIDGQRASPARPGTTSGRHGPVLDGPPRADGPTVPCRYGLRAWPSAQARHYGPFFVPGQPV